MILRVFAIGTAILMIGGMLAVTLLAERHDVVDWRGGQLVRVRSDPG